MIKSGFEILLTLFNNKMWTISGLVSQLVFRIIWMHLPLYIYDGRIILKKRCMNMMENELQSNFWEEKKGMQTMSGRSWTFLTLEKERLRSLIYDEENFFRIQYFHTPSLKLNEIHDNIDFFECEWISKTIQTSCEYIFLSKRITSL